MVSKSTAVNQNTTEYTSPTLKYVKGLNLYNEKVEKYVHMILNVAMVQFFIQKFYAVSSKYQKENNKYYNYMVHLLQLFDQMFYLVIVQNGIQEFNKRLTEKNNKVGLWCIKWFFNDYLYSTIIIDLIYEKVLLSLKKEKYDVLVEDLNKKYNEKLSQNDNDLSKTIVNTGFELGSFTVRRLRQTTSI